MSRIDESTSFLEVSLIILMLGTGLGLVMQVLVLAVQNAVERRDMGVATASVTFFRQIGGSLGVALLGAILANRLNYHIERLVPADALQGLDPASLRSSPEQLQMLPPEVYTGVVEAFANAIQSVYFWALPAVLVTFALSWVLQDLPLRSFAHAGPQPGQGEAAAGTPHPVGGPARPRPTEAAEGAPGSG
jgi:hypothetical protein